MSKYLLSVFLFVALGFVNAQATYTTAYVVTLKGDTIKGEAKLNPKRPTEIFDKIAFKDANGIQKNYKPEKVKAYGVAGDHFVSLTNDGDPKFYQILSTGAVNLYVIVFEAMQMNEVVYESEYYITYPDNKRLVMIKKNKFKKQVSEWMKDNPEFVNEYTEDKDFDPQQAIAVFTKYNAWKAEQKN